MNIAYELCNSSLNFNCAIMRNYEPRQFSFLHSQRLEAKIYTTFDNIHFYINSYQVTFYVEQEAFLQLQLLHPTLQNNIPSTTIIPITDRILTSMDEFDVKFYR